MADSRNNHRLAELITDKYWQVFHGSDDDALLQGYKWHSHLSGQVAIVLSRCPYDYQTGVSHQLFVDGRYPLVSRMICSPDQVRPCG